MPRSPRSDSESGIHHVMNRGGGRQPIFFADADRIEFGRRLEAIHEDHGVVVLAYCLMGNHFHLLLQVPPGTLSVAMHHLTSVFVRHVNDRVGRDGPLFRGRFLSLPVETDAYLIWVVRYIHRNPLDLPGVRDPADYRWSSYRAFLGLRPAPKFLDIDPVMRIFGGTVADLAAFTESDAGADAPRPLIAPTPMTRSALSYADVRHLVSGAIRADAMTAPDGAHGSGLERTVLLLLPDRIPDPTLRDTVVAGLDHPSPRAAVAAARRAGCRVEDDPAVGRVLAWLEPVLTLRPVLAA